MTRVADEVVVVKVGTKGPTGNDGEQGSQGNQGPAGPVGPHGLIPFPIATATGTVDAIIVDYDPDLQLVDMLIIAFISTGENTVVDPEINPDGYGFRTITKNGGQPLDLGNIGPAGSTHILGYDLNNLRWELINPAVIAADIIDGGVVV